MDTEYLGKVVLIAINFLPISTLIYIGFRTLKNDYELRNINLEPILKGILCSSIFIFVWFITPLKSLFDNHLIEKLFVSFESNNFIVYSFLLLSLIFSLYYIKKWNEVVRNNYYLDINVVLFLIGILFFYWTYRIESSAYHFYSVWEDDHRRILKILDLPAFSFSIFLILLFIHSLFRRRYVTNYNSNIVADIPLTNIENDEYQRRDFYQNLITHIVNNDVNSYKSVNIAIINSWGEGKTSFINFLRDDFNKDQNTIVIEFNPWHSTSSNFTLDFFQTFDEAISQHIHTGSLIRNYARSLSNIDSVFNITKYAPSNWIGDKSNKEFYDSIDDLIKKLGRRIVVFIDDLDRLDNKEVINALQVIRNSGGFSNCMFIVPFDKSYVLNSLKVNRIYNPKEYIKKIFDVELTLPPISKLYMQNITENYISKLISEKIENITDLDQAHLLEQLNKIVYAINHFGTAMLHDVKFETSSRILFKLIKNKRDLVRFANSLMAHLIYTHAIIYLPDLVILELIKIIDIEVYKKLFTENNYLKVELNGVVSKYVINKCEDTNVNDRDDCLCLKSNQNLDASYLVELLDALFAEPQLHEFNHNNSIVYPQNFLNYMEYRSAGISNDEIDILFE